MQITITVQPTTCPVDLSSVLSCLVLYTNRIPENKSPHNHSSEPPLQQKYHNLNATM
jgi:hypothetical protein